MQGNGGRTSDVRETELVLAATRALVGMAARSLAGVADDVSVPQYRLLVLLESRGPQTMGTVAASLDVSASTATRACDRLVEKELVVRRADESDRRSVRVHLTPAGRNLVDQVMSRRRREIDAVLARMSPEARKRLARALADFAVTAGGAGDDRWGPDLALAAD